ncbi:MAG: OsmC family protein [Pseudomonadota bacterium]
MDIDYARLKHHVEETIHGLASGRLDPIRRPSAQLQVVRGLQGEVQTGKFRFRTDAAIDAGGFAEHPRPMDYLLGGLASCQQMWCLRWAALQGVTLTHLAISAESVFSWHGEYLQQIDAGMNALNVVYDVAADGFTATDACDMADMVARRCPVLATLRRAVPIHETLRLPGQPDTVRQWEPGRDSAVPAAV